VLAVCLVALTVTASTQAPVERTASQPGPPSQTISDNDVAAALAKVKADPNLSPKRTLTIPRRNSSGKPWGWLKWIVQLFRFIAQYSRALIWTAVIALAIWLVAYFIRGLAARNARDSIGRVVTPTHVRDLDIRPESLPADIGAAARALWDAGQRRAALALLYRGLLSRLAHVHRVPIRDSTTEGDCLTLTRDHLTQARFEYSARLITVWQRAVYGGTDAEAPIVYELCDAFSGALDAATAPVQVTS
jgi:hypothetical protein